MVAARAGLMMVLSSVSGAVFSIVCSRDCDSQGRATTACSLLVVLQDFLHPWTTGCQVTWVFGEVECLQLLAGNDYRDGVAIGVAIVEGVAVSMGARLVKQVRGGVGVLASTAGVTTRRSCRSSAVVIWRRSRMRCSRSASFLSYDVAAPAR